ncbi:kinase-like domain-containing protein [Lentinula aff. detonsa]|nr:kinase-like domain-containing protein [Lentinula aff. detonsa]
MSSHLNLHPITIPELAYSPHSPSESGFPSPAESDALRTPSFPEHSHPLLAFSGSPDPSSSKHAHAHTHDILSTNTACDYGLTTGFGLLPSLCLDNARVEDASTITGSIHQSGYPFTVSNDAFPSPISSHTTSPSVSSPRLKAQHTFPAYKANSPRTPIIDYNLNSSIHSRHFPSGHQLNPHFVRIYELGDELGSGGYGFVVTAKNRNKGHEVAVKFIIKEKVPDYAWVNDERYGRLPTEVVILSNIEHKNIVKCLDIFEDAKYYYLVQELHGTPWHNPKFDKKPVGENSHPPAPSSVPPLSPSISTDSISSRRPSTPSHTSSPITSQLCAKPPKLEAPRPPMFHRRPSHDLFECIEQSDNKYLSEDQARYVFGQIVDAVDYLDSIGVAHRDIKDENIVIDTNLKVKLIDFGSATFTDPAEPRPFYNLFYGTTAYAASEILQKKVYQAAPAEVWTLGVLLSYLLTGTSPFPTVKDAIAGKIVLTDCPRVSRQALKLMHVCLDPNPKARVTIQEVKSHPWLRPRRA